MSNPSNQPHTQSDAVILARLDERTRAMSEQLNGIKRDVESLKVEVDDRLNGLDGQFVTRAEYLPVRALVYGFVGLVLCAVAAGIISLVVSNGGPLR